MSIAKQLAGIRSPRTVNAPAQQQPSRQVLRAAYRHMMKRRAFHKRELDRRHKANEVRDAKGLKLIDTPLPMYPEATSVADSGYRLVLRSPKTFKSGKVPLSYLKPVLVGKPRSFDMDPATAMALGLI